MKKALVTGATGFLGKRLALALKKQGYKVTATGRNVSFKSFFDQQDIAFQACDLVQSKEIDSLINDHDIVFHCAALSSPWGPYKNFYAANVSATRNLLEASLKAGVSRFVHVSSSSVYFDFKDKLNIKESDAPLTKHVNAYASTKAQSEDLVRSYFEKGLATIVIRPRGIYGSGDTALMPRLLRVAKLGRVPVFGAGDNLIDLTHVDDVVQSLLLCATAPKSLLGKSINISGDDPQPLVDILKTVFANVQKPFRPVFIPLRFGLSLAAALEFVFKLIPNAEPVVTKYSVGLLGFSQTLNIDLAKNELGYQPKVKLQEGLSYLAQTLD
jgi:nucleoside-diphosphate-sugar epimerase